MSTRHLGTRAGGHSNLDDSYKSAVKDHLRSCHQCCNGVCDVSCFKILRKCKTDYDTKIHEALLIKKLKPQLNNTCIYIAVMDQIKSKIRSDQIKEINSYCIWKRRVNFA